MEIVSPKVSDLELVTPEEADLLFLGAYDTWMRYTEDEGLDGDGAEIEDLIIGVDPHNRLWIMFDVEDPSDDPWDFDQVEGEWYPMYACYWDAEQEKWIHTRDPAEENYP